MIARSRSRRAPLSARALARQMTAERERLEARNARYEQWVADTRGRRETAGQARAELHRRAQAHPQQEQQVQPTAQSLTMTGWWQQFEADIQAVERVIARQHQAAIAAGDPWPPQRAPEPDPPAAPGLDPEASPEDDEPARDDTAARLDELLGRADQAAQRIAEQEAERQAGSDYAARIERAEPETGHHAEPRDQAEIEP